MMQDASSESNMGKIGFPRELLNCSINDRLNYFENYIVPHKFLENAISDTFNFITSKISERLVFVCGPSGVGKKVLIKEIKKMIVKQQSATLIENPGCIPVVDVEAIAPEQGSFNFRNLWRSALINLNEPMLDQKISYGETKVRNTFGQNIILSRIQKADYMEVLQNALKYREVKALIINEAHHMLRVASGKKANWSVDLLKTLTNCSQTPIILVGTYDLTSFLEDLNLGITDQINQRTKVVNFPRYRQSVKNEVQIFGKTAKKLLLNMPLEQTAEKLVDEDWKYFYTYSLGCIGSLKNWLMDAYSLAIKSESKTLTREHLEATRISGHRCLGMLQSIENGERNMEKIQSEGDILKKLGFAKSESTSEKNYPKEKPKPFERNPKRDVVGI